MAILKILTDKINNYFKTKQQKRKFLKQLEQEVLYESKDEIKQAMKQKIIKKEVDRLTTNKSDKFKNMFNSSLIKNADSKIERMMGKKSFGNNIDKFMTRRR